MNQEILIGNRKISAESPAFIIAELSGNHNQDLGRALAIIEAAGESGADAIKLQTYTADTITMDCRNQYFAMQTGTLWKGRILYDLYQEAHTPWSWHDKLFQKAEESGLICFSSPFDKTAVDFLEQLNAPAYKIASYEINDIPLIRRVAQTGRPVIISTGIAALSDIELALQTCREEGNQDVILLKCTSAYPAPYQEMNLRVLPHMAETFQCMTGLSDHSYGTEVAVAAAALGAKVVEKHLTLSRQDGGVDSDFSMEPKEFARMVKEIRNVESALGTVTYELTEKQKESKRYSRSLFAAEDIRKGQAFSESNVRSVRPGYGIQPRYLDEILGKQAKRDISRGMPLKWEDIS
jgi:pseudaminic acid synthase